jgi:hypothetical protein
MRKRLHFSLCHVFFWYLVSTYLLFFFFILKKKENNFYFVGGDLIPKPVTRQVVPLKHIMMIILISPDCLVTKIDFG